MDRPSRIVAHETRPELVWPVRRDRRGLTGPTPAEAAGPNWRRTSWGFYVAASVEQSVEQRILEAATVLPAYGGVTGWAALRWQGARWFDGIAHGGRTQLPVWLVTSCDDIRPQAGISVSAERLDPRDLIVVDDVSLTTAVRSVCFEMRYAASLWGAVGALAMAAYSDLVSIDELRAYALEHPGWTGIPQCREAIPLTDENLWSPYEVDMYLTWRLVACLPAPLCNHPVFDRAGNHIGTPDLLDVEAGVAGEYDSTLHLRGAQRSRDLRREELFRGVGLEYFTMLSADRADPQAMAERMHATRRRAAWAAESTRAWTIEPPPWWTPTHTVELRRALSPRLRERLLRHRAA